MNEFCWKLLFHSFEWTSSAFFIIPPINKLCFRPVGWNQGLTCRALTVLLTLPPPLHSSPAITLSHSLYISLFIIDANTRTHITLSDLRTVTHPLCLSYTKSQSHSYSPTRTLSFSLSLSNSPSLAHTLSHSLSSMNTHTHSLSLLEGWFYLIGARAGFPFIVVPASASHQLDFASPSHRLEIFFPVKKSFSVSVCECSCDHDITVAAVKLVQCWRPMVFYDGSLEAVLLVHHCEVSFLQLVTGFCVRRRQQQQQRPSWVFPRCDLVFKVDAEHRISGFRDHASKSLTIVRTFRWEQYNIKWYRYLENYA